MDRSWYHGRITGIQAENLLKNEGKHGSYLFRPSSEGNNRYCLSVRVGDSVTHVKINNDGECFSLLSDGAEAFATLAELVRHYTDDMAKELRDVAGNRIELKYPLPSVDHYSERFFHHNLTAREAEQRMLSINNSIAGTFLVRPSQSQTDCFVLSIVVLTQKVKVLHVKITYQDRKYGIGDGCLFNSLSELVNHYRRNIVKDKSGIEITLRQAVDWTRLKASDINFRVAQLDKEFTLNGAKRSGFWEEFEHLQMQESIQSASRSTGEKPENKKKNRYKNILPYDETRIILTDVDPATPGSDYINANGIQVPDDTIPGGMKRYIATQGCLHQTISDFWLMAFQQDSSIIVMITKIVEDGKNKCALYWAEGEDGNTAEYNIHEGTITVMLKEKPTNTSANYIKRVFEVVKHQRTGKSSEPETQMRMFYHYQFQEWKDKRVPTHSEISNVLQFVEDINDQWRTTNCASPIIVHCSAGIGRTGTFIVIDTIVNQIIREGLDADIDIFKTIHSLRRQRSGFVQTDLQYKFIYIAIRRFVEQRRNQPAQPTSSAKPPLSNAEDVDVFYENIPESGALRPVPKPKPVSVKPPKPKTPNKPAAKASDGSTSSGGGSSSRSPQENNNPTILYENLHSVTNSSA